MAMRFICGDGNFCFSLAAGAPTSIPGIWMNSNFSTVSGSAPAGRATTYAWTASGGPKLTSPLLPSTYAGLIAGYAGYTTLLPPSISAPLITFYDGGGNIQCDVRVNSVGQLYFTRNGTTIAGPTSQQYIFTNSWYFLEFKALFSVASTGTCEVRVNGVTALTASSLTNATGTAVGGQVQYYSGNWVRDFYCLDTVSGLDTNYQGDCSIIDTWDNSIDQAGGGNWTVFQGTFTLTAAANASGGTTVYTGTITNGATNTWQGQYFTVAGFTNVANNGTFICTASSGTTITLANTGGVSETHAGTAAFQNPVQSGIHGSYEDGAATTLVGTRPQADNLQYIYSSTPGNETWYTHQTLTLAGAIIAVAPVLYARKDDGGGTTRQIANIIVEGGSVVATGATQTLGTTYQYYMDVYEADPGTSVAWTTSGFNSAEFGCKEVA